MKQAKRNRYLPSILLALFVLLLPASADGANGELDPSYSEDGYLLVDIGFDNDIGRAVAVQPDGKIILAGSADNDVVLVRTRPNGALDSDFGSGSGIVKTDFGLSDDAGHGLALQADNKILVAGSADGDFALARYHPDGALDRSFDGDGWVTADFADNDDVASAVVVQPDGKILVAGSTTLGKAALARYHADGSLDMSFGTAGLVTVDFASDGSLNWSTGNAVALQPDGKIVVAGAGYWLEPLPGPPFDTRGAEPANDRPQIPSAPLIQSDFAMARLLANGQLDPDFGHNGTVITDFSDREDVAYAVAIQPDGKIVLGGSTLPPYRSRNFALARYDEDGSRDLTFGGYGQTTVDFSTALGIHDSSDSAHAVALQADGRILIIGNSSRSFDQSDFALARVDTDGSLDLTLDGDDGLVVTDFGGAYDTGNAACLQLDQRIVVTGQSGGDIIVARYGILEQIFLPSVRQE